MNPPPRASSSAQNATDTPGRPFVNGGINKKKKAVKKAVVGLLMGVNKLVLNNTKPAAVPACTPPPLLSEHFCLANRS